MPWAQEDPLLISRHLAKNRAFEPWVSGLELRAKLGALNPNLEAVISNLPIAIFPLPFHSKLTLLF